MTVPDRLLIVATCLIVAGASWWSFAHPADTPRFSAGFGSSASPETRRFWGAVTGLLAILVAVLAVLL